MKTENINNTLSKLLKTIKQTCKTVCLTNSVDELEEVVDIIIKQNNSSITKIVYKLGGFKDSLVKTTNISDSDEATKFIKSINENKDKKKKI